MAESIQRFFEISARDLIAADYTVIMSRTLKVTGKHVKFALFVLLPVSEEAKTGLSFVFVQCIIKQLFDSVFLIPRLIKVSVRVVSQSLRLRLNVLIEDASVSHQMYDVQYRNLEVTSVVSRT